MASKELISFSGTAAVFTATKTDRPELFCLCCNNKISHELEILSFKQTAVYIHKYVVLPSKGEKFYCISLSKWMAQYPI